MVERKQLDLYSLHRLVQEEGGLETVTKERKWSKIAVRLTYPNGKNVGTILKGHYERILYPYDIYMSGKVVDGAVSYAIFQFTQSHEISFIIFRIWKLAKNLTTAIIDLIASSLDNPLTHHQKLLPVAQSAFKTSNHRIRER